MKIAFVDFSLDPSRPGTSGLSDMVWNMAAKLIDIGDEVHIVAPYTTEVYPTPGVHVHKFGIPAMGYRNVIGHVLIVLRAWRELRKIERLDVIHAPEYTSTGILSVLIRDVPVVLTVPGNIYERIKNGNPYDWITTLAYKLFARLSARYCATIIALSKDMKYWWEYTGAPPERVKIIPLGIDDSLFRPVPGAKAKLGMDPGCKVILYAGRLSGEKGIEYLLEAFASINADSAPSRLFVVGKGPRRDQLVETADRLGLGDKVVFKEWAPMHEMPCYYSSADAYVLPSFSEGMPRVMVEAMGCGAPFIGTTISGVVDHIVEGQTGFLVPPGDAKALADKLKFVLDNPAVAREVAERGRDYVHENLTWTKVMLRVRNEVYMPLAEKRADRRKVAIA